MSNISQPKFMKHFEGPHEEEKKREKKKLQLFKKEVTSFIDCVLVLVLATVKASEVVEVMVLDPQLL